MLASRPCHRDRLLCCNTGLGRRGLSRRFSLAPGLYPRRARCAIDRVRTWGIEDERAAFALSLLRMPCRHSNEKQC